MLSRIIRKEKRTAALTAAVLAVVMVLTARLQPLRRQRDRERSPRRRTRRLTAATGGMVWITGPSDTGIIIIRIPEMAL